jgi:hypothetical protein
MDLSKYEEAAAYLASMIDGEGGVYFYPRKCFIRVTMTVEEPMFAVVECCDTLGITTNGVKRLKRVTETGRTIFVVEIAQQDALIRASEVLDLRHPAKRTELERIATHKRKRSIERRIGKICTTCGERKRPLRRGVCNRCRLRVLRQEAATQGSDG